LNAPCCFWRRKILDIDESVSDAGVQGVKRSWHLDMLDQNQRWGTRIWNHLYWKKSGWIRAQCSGMLHDNGCIDVMYKRHSSRYHYRSFGVWTKGKRT
jgi:hypothetical protein